MNMIPLTGMEIFEFVPEFFKQQEDLKQKPTFYLRVPTFAMRDKMAAVLFQRGLVPAQVAIGRGLLIDALYELYDEPTADDHAAFLESYWTRDEVHSEMINAWQLREAQRLFDLGMGVKPSKERPMEQEPLPPPPFTMREQARQASILHHVLDNSDSYRSYQARFMAQTQEEEEMLLRLFIDDWKNCGEIACRRDEMDRIEPDCIEAIRGWLHEQGANSAWDEVKGAIKSHFGAPGGLEKNLGLPLDTHSSPTGSQVSSGDLAISGGSSTKSSTTPTLNGKSDPTSRASRSLPSGKGGRRRRASAGAKKTGRTAVHS